MNRLGLQLTASIRVTRRAVRHSPLRSRCLHTRKELSYPIEGGLGDFLPPHTLKMVAVDYQQGLLNRLNDEVKNTEQENKSVVQTVIDTAVDPAKVLAFSYASEALNNSFFLECMKPPPADDISYERHISHELGAQIRINFGNLDQLKSNIGATALGMFSSGWIWLACDQHGHLAVIPTFGAGTLLVRSQQVQTDNAWSVVGHDLMPPSISQHSAPAFHTSPADPTPPGPTSPTSGASHSIPPLHPQSPSRTLSTTTSRSSTPQVNSIYTRDPKKPSSDPVRDLGSNLFPLFCLSIHEHAWISAGYGVWGKEEYVKRFWSVVDWAFVSNSFRKFSGMGR